jgi:hypothetical protein
MLQNNPLHVLGMAFDGETEGSDLELLHLGVRELSEVGELHDLLNLPV